MFIVNYPIIFIKIMINSINKLLSTCKVSNIRSKFFHFFCVLILDQRTKGQT